MADSSSGGVTVRANNEGVIEAALEHMLKRYILVGIPEENASKGRKGEEPNNAELAFIHTFGSPIKHIPARPFLEPAITEQETLDRIGEYYKKSAQAAFNGDFAGSDVNLGKAGMVARNAVVKYIDDSSRFVPNAPYTIMMKGSDKPLIDTGSLRTSITYVFKDGE